MKKHNRIGINIRKAREFLGMSQVALGKMAGMTQAMISRYEIGLRFPDSRQIDDLAFALNDIIPGILLAEEILFLENGVTVSVDNERLHLHSPAEKHIPEEGSFFDLSYSDTPEHRRKILQEAKDRANSVRPK